MALSFSSLMWLFASLTSLPQNELLAQPGRGVGGGVSEMLI